jgi:hypothetical protein
LLEFSLLVPPGVLEGPGDVVVVVLCDGELLSDFTEVV